MDIEVLDLGYVQLLDFMGSDLTVVNAARVSFDKESEYESFTSIGLGNLSDKDVKLIAYLAKHNHWTPFAHPQVRMRIKAPISIRTQFFKHKQGFVENEISGRYVEQKKPDIYVPVWRSKAKNSKQGSFDFIDSDLEDDAESISKILDKAYIEAVNHAEYVYNKLLSYGVAPEQARFVLPQGTYTEWIWTGSLAAYARFYNQRIDSHAQWEIRKYAKAVGEIMKNIFPISWEHLTTQAGKIDAMGQTQLG